MESNQMKRTQINMIVGQNYGVAGRSIGDTNWWVALLKMFMCWMLCGYAMADIALAAKMVGKKHGYLANDMDKAIEGATLWQKKFPGFHAKIKRWTPMKNQVMKIVIRVASFKF